MTNRPSCEGFSSAAAEGSVLLDGAGVAVTVDPERALHIAKEMTDAAAEAMGQQKITDIHGNSLSQSVDRA